MKQTEHNVGEIRSVLGVICSSYGESFEAEKEIADYMMECKAGAVDMTVGEPIGASGTSDTTVSRFCRRCGFKGFHNLKLTSAREVLEEEQMDKNVSNDTDRGNPRQSLQNILADKVTELTETVNMMDPANLEHILGKLEHARIVQLAVVGNIIPIVLDGAFKFNQLGIPAVTGDIWGAQAAYTFNPGHEDVVTVISDSGSPKRLQTLVEGARDNECTVILITDSGNSPLAGICDYKIVTATREKLLIERFWLSRTTATAVMEILYLLLRAGMEDSVKHVRRHEKVILPDKK